MYLTIMASDHLDLLIKYLTKETVTRVQYLLPGHRVFEVGLNFHFMT